MRRALFVLPWLAGLACVDATPPERPDAYAYAVPVPGEVQIIFRWMPDQLPVRVWAESSLRPQAAEAIRTWQDVALYGEFRGVLVADSGTADVILRRAPPANINESPALDCEAITAWTVDLDAREMLLPIGITVAPRSGSRSEEIERCFRTIVASHLGVALGLLVDSDDPEDLRYRRPTATFPSLRDRATFGQLYHSTPTVGLPPGR